MRPRTRLALAGLAATLLMSLAVSSTSANRLSINNTRIRITWSALEFLDEVGNPQVTCRVTVEGSFHSATIRKVRGALIGYMTRGIIDSGHCEGGIGSILQERLPWHVTYDSFEGILPDIVGMRLLLHGTGFEVSLFGVNCGYEGDATHRAIAAIRITQPGGLANEFLFDPSIRLLRRRGSFLCPAESGLRGTGQLFLLNSTQRINVTLI